MKLSQDLLNELKNILREDFGIEPNKQEVSEIANSLVSYFDLLAKLNFSQNQKHKDN